MKYSSNVHGFAISRPGFEPRSGHFLDESHISFDFHFFCYYAVFFFILTSFDRSPGEDLKKVGYAILRRADAFLFRS